MVIKNITDISWTKFVLDFIHKNADVLQSPIR